MKEVAAELEQWLRAGEPIAIATVVRITGSAPRPLGATLIARVGERIAGSVSNGCVEAAVYEEAMAVLADGRPRVASYGISDEFAFTVGLSCGGAIDVLIEPVGAFHRAALAAVRSEHAVVLARIVEPGDRTATVALLRDGGAEGWSDELATVRPQALVALGDGRSRSAATRLRDGREATVFLEALAMRPLLFIVGATHVAQALTPIAKSVGYRVVVADPRAALADRERFPLADEILLAWPDQALRRAHLGASAAVVILAHDAKFDHPALVAALRSDAGYVGAIGSRTTNEQRFAWLRGQGFTDADLARVHAPIGLDIGAATAEEIALAILAEVVATRHGRGGRSLSSETLAAAR